MPPEPHPTHQSLFSLTSPAFDTVSHQILLSTLAELGIADSALRGFTSYLTNGIFQVTWKGSLSKPCFLETGVPQGSVSGLLLLSLYTRSLGFASTFHGFSYHHYADDTQLFLSSPPSFYNTYVATHISECLADIFAWTAACHLKCNLSKTELFNLEKDCPYMYLSVTVEDVTVSPSLMARNPDIILDNGLSCTPNITADLPSTTSTGSSLSSQKTQLNSWPQRGHFAHLHRLARWYPHP